MVQRIMQWDKNQDGKVTKNELPANMQRLFARLDANKDGTIEKAEVEQMAKRLVPGSGSVAERQPPAKDVGAQTATHIEIAPLPIKFKDLNCLRLRPDGYLLAADVGDKLIKVIHPSGHIAGTIDPGFAPEIIALAEGGTIYCAGEGYIAKLASDGSVTKKVKLPEQSADKAPPRRGGSHPPGVSGVAASDDAVFVTFGSGWSVSAKARLYRFDLDLENPKLLAEGLRGCCQHCDIYFRDGVLYLAENAAYRVVGCDRDGQVIKKWGAKSRDDLQQFGSCCNPMNLDFDAAGTLYTGESGLGRVKRYSPDGKFLGLVGYLDVQRFTRGSRFASVCCSIPIAVTPNGDRVYVTDVHDNIIRVLARKSAASTHKTARNARGGS